MSAGHDHTQGMEASKLRLAFILTMAILVVEAAAGWASHSLALLSDAGHILTDVVALGLAWYAITQSQRPADASHSYGYHRVGILAAMANAVTLILIVVWIAYEALQRLQHPEPVAGGVVIVAALVAIVVNAFIALSLRQSGKNINIRAALLHVTGDLAASVGVVVAGVVILLTGWLPIDPLLSLGIAALIAWSAIRIVLSTTSILLEATPEEIDLAKVRAEFEGTAGIESLHDLHVWSIGSGELALSGHVVVSTTLMDDVEHLIRDIEGRICANFNISHSTIQAESCHPCDDDGDHLPGFHNHPHANDHVHPGIANPAHGH